VRVSLASAKADLLKAISEAIGKQLTSEQTEQIEIAVEKRIKAEIEPELADQIEDRLKAEIEADIRASLKNEIGDDPRRSRRAPSRIIRATPSRHALTLPLLICISRFP
jgi:hypothetical protein